MLIHDLVSPLTSLVGALKPPRKMLVERPLNRSEVLHFMNMGSRNGGFC